MDRADPQPDRVRLGRHRHHLGLRRPHPARDLPVRPRAPTTGSPPPRSPSVRPPPQRRPPPPRQARPPAATSRSASARRRHRRRPAVEALPGHRPRDDRSTCRCATTTCSSPCSAGRSTLLAPRPGRGHGRGGRRRVRPGHGRRAMGDGRRPASGRSAPRCTPSPTPSPPTGSPPTPRSRQRAAHRLRALPVRRRRHRAPGHLRGRPRAWSRACSARSTARRHASPIESSLPSGDDLCVTAVEALTRPPCRSVAPARLPRPRLHLAAAARGGRRRAAGWPPGDGRRRPGRIHAEGMTSRVALEQAREQVAALLGRPARARSCSPAAPPRPIAAATWGAVRRAVDAAATHVVLAAVEHSAVRQPSAARSGLGDGHRGRRRPPSAGSTPTSCWRRVGPTPRSCTCSGATTRSARSSPWPRSWPRAASGACSSTSTPPRPPAACRSTSAPSAPTWCRSAATSSAAPPAPARCCAPGPAPRSRCSSAATRSAPGGPGSRTCPPWSASAPPPRRWPPAARPPRSRRSRGASPTASLVDGLRRGRGRARSRRPRPEPRSPTSSASASRASSPRPCCSGSTSAASPPTRAARARPRRSSRHPCSRPWASTPTARCGSRSAGAPTDDDVEAAITRAPRGRRPPAFVGRLRRSPASAGIRPPAHPSPGSISADPVGQRPPRPWPPEEVSAPDGASVVGVEPPPRATSRTCWPWLPASSSWLWS